jgi:hypothetical protein
MIPQNFLDDGLSIGEESNAAKRESTLGVCCQTSQPSGRGRMWENRKIRASPPRPVLSLKYSHLIWPNDNDKDLTRAYTESTSFGFFYLKRL